MTATAFALDPALDRFDDVDHRAPTRPELRLIGGEGHGDTGHGRAVDLSGDRSRSLASVEVYRRRRFFALVAATIMILAGAWLAGVSVTDFSGPSMAEAGTTAPTVHVVVPGDSYAAIAADLGAANPVASAPLLQAANGGGELVVGQRLVIDAVDLAVEID